MAASTSSPSPPSSPPLQARPLQTYFSWRNPGMLGSSLPILGEVLDQAGFEICICFALASYLQAELNIMWERAEQPKPNRPASIPWEQFAEMLVGWPEDRKIMHELISEVTNIGFHDREGNHYEIANAWDTIDPDSETFEEELQEGLESGPWIADLWYTEEFSDQNGKEMYRATGAQLTGHTKETREPGHTVVVTGYGFDGREKFWEFMNSHGTGYGDNGFGRAANTKTLNWLYKPEVLHWW